MIEIRHKLNGKVIKTILLFCKTDKKVLKQIIENWLEWDVKDVK
jgi:hypothetical protein